MIVMCLKTTTFCNVPLFALCVHRVHYYIKYNKYCQLLRVFRRITVYMKGWLLDYVHVCESTCWYICVFGCAGMDLCVVSFLDYHIAITICSIALVCSRCNIHELLLHKN